MPTKVNDGAADSNTLQISMTVNPHPDSVTNGARIAQEPGGGYRIAFIGNPGQQYTVQYNSGLTPADWQFHSFQMADPNGMFWIVDNPPPETTARFYRAIVP